MLINSAPRTLVYWWPFVGSVSLAFEESKMFATRFSVFQVRGCRSPDFTPPTI